MKRKLHVGIFICTVLVVWGIFALNKTRITFATEKVHQINNLEDFYNAMFMSRQPEYVEDTYVLNTDIVWEENNTIPYASFGSEKNPFSGVFDGKGHTISGLRCNLTEADAQSDTGLFSHTHGAVIKNLVIEDAKIDADQRGGIVVGKAVDTIFENITVKNSAIRISCYNNVLTLVTDGGLRGGAFVGDSLGCTFYNCESENNSVRNNNTAGVSALGGKGLYLGGLVGRAESYKEQKTLIEYSRVIKGEITSYYDVAVGALGGNTLYVGGIVGEMSSGSKLVDCFATPYLYYYTATYVSVGAGNSGHVGGIAGAAYGSGCEIERCHFAGTMESKQYNAILVIPIIQKNVNLSGLVDKIPDAITVYDSYFKQSETGAVDTLGNATTTFEYGPQNDEIYKDVSFWSSHGYDFVGNVERNTAYGNSHTNKWVMDLEQGIPVHGASVSATLDFPNAGMVTIKETSLVHTEVSTTNPYQFVVQGILPKEQNITIEASANEGYRFVNWYKVPNIYASTLLEDYDFFKEIFENHSYGPLNSGSAIYVDTNCKDNDLYIARYQAQVVFHDIHAMVIDTGEDWYDCGASIPNVEPMEKPSGSGAKFIGWVDFEDENVSELVDYLAITSAQLQKLKNEGRFYQSGDVITKALSLYPVYTDVISKIYTVLEGNEQDSIDDLTLREGVGRTWVTMDEDGIPMICVESMGNSSLEEKGYRFLGWYDEGGNRISDKLKHTLKDVDLTKQDSYTYTAKLEYRVDYYSETKDVVETVDTQPYASIWHTYQEVFFGLKDVPLDGEDTFSHWANIRKEDKCNGCSNQISQDHKVITPMAVYAHISGSSGHDILITSDFPGSGTLSNRGNPGLSGEFAVNMLVNSGYHFLFWAGEGGEAKWTDVFGETTWQPSGIYLTTRDYYFKAHLNADVTYYTADQSTILETVTRHYKETVYLESDQTHTYTYPISGKEISGKVDVSEKTPLAPMQEDCYFIGWIDGSKLKGTSQWNYIYDVSVSNSLTSDMEKVIPYLITKEDIVTKSMELYPVYIKYNVETSTNIREQGVINSMVQTPPNPEYSGIDTQKLTSVITVLADTHTYITGTSGEIYRLCSITVKKGNEEVDVVIPDSNGAIRYEIEAGHTYKFIANYETLVVIYHTNKTETKIVVRKKGEILGETPMAQAMEQYVFLGWTIHTPTQGWFWSLQDNLLLVEGNTMVMDSMELWPVYSPISLLVNSNIDNIDQVGTKHRYLTVLEDSTMVWMAQAEEVEGYQFMGWYKSYVDETNRGILLDTNKTYPLTVEALTTKEIYTAVYEKVPSIKYEICYYGLSGEVLCLVPVYDFEAERTFVAKSILEVNGVELERETPLDIDAFVLLEEQLSSHQILNSWYYDDSGEMVMWEDFKDKSVETILTELDTKILHLFPITYEASAIDSDEIELNVNTSNATLMLGWDLSEEKPKVASSFLKDYGERQMKIRVREQVYGWQGEIENKELQNILVRLTLTEGMGNEIWTKNTDVYGVVLFEFIGKIQIKKFVEGGTGEDIFVFSLVNLSNMSEKLEFVVKESTQNQEHIVIVEVPYGIYMIEENVDWAWRYEAIEEKNASMMVTINAKNEMVECNFWNKVVKPKWFAFTERRKNEFQRLLSEEKETL